ncbi:hypothetical protein Droror1_Dr00025747 [Drosera rotundifolia]
MENSGDFQRVRGSLLEIGQRREASRETSIESYSLSFFSTPPSTRETSIFSIPFFPSSIPSSSSWLNLVLSGNENSKESSNPVGVLELELWGDDDWLFGF